jgi:hypothetical protein
MQDDAQTSVAHNTLLHRMTFLEPFTNNIPANRRFDYNSLPPAYVKSKRGMACNFARANV